MTTDKHRKNHTIVPAGAEYPNLFDHIHSKKCLSFTLVARYHHNYFHCDINYHKIISIMDCPLGSVTKHKVQSLCLLRSCAEVC